VAESASLEASEERCCVDGFSEIGCFSLASWEGSEGEASEGPLLSGSVTASATVCKKKKQKRENREGREREEQRERARKNVMKS